MSHLYSSFHVRADCECGSERRLRKGRGNFLMVNIGARIEIKDDATEQAISDTLIQAGVFLVSCIHRREPPPVATAKRATLTLAGKGRIIQAAGTWVVSRYILL